MLTVQDPPSPPSDTILLSPLKWLYKTNVRIQERPQPGDSRPVMSPSQHPLSKQIMRNWEPWKTNIEKSNNHRIHQQLVFHIQQSIRSTSVQDLDPRSWTNNTHVSVLTHEIVTIEPSENPTQTLTWKPLDFLNHIKRRTNEEGRSSFSIDNLNRDFSKTEVVKVYAHTIVALAIDWWKHTIEVKKVGTEAEWMKKVCIFNLLHVLTGLSVWQTMQNYQHSPMYVLGECW